ncbi:MAG: AHH domain-containing protein [Acetobacteraceae bacterium]
MVRHLAEADWEAHHLVNMAALQYAPELVKAAVEAGWGPDSVPNIVALPKSAEAQQKIRQVGVSRPVHNSSHLNWNRDVEVILRRANGDFDEGGGAFQDARTRGTAARRFLEQEATKLRARMMHSDRITSIERPEDVHTA